MVLTLDKKKYSYRSANNVHDLWIQLAKHKSVYFWPLNRMMPTAFFKGYIWHDALYIHFEMGHFYFRGEKSNSERIRETIKNFELPA